jgi:peptidoglycan/xylan/chitin deacetylase (PgdA/CDA1 family)
MMIILYIFSGLIIVCLAWLVISYSFLIPAGKGLTILMYHNVSEDKADGLTIPAWKLDQQLSFVRDQGYTVISFGELSSLIKAGKSLPPKPLILTFDDGYENFYSGVLPLLKKYNFTATVFVPVSFIGKTNAWDIGEERIMGAETIKELTVTGLAEVGLHSFLHRNYAGLTIDEIKQDLTDCKNALESDEIPFVPVLAYPFGGFPRKDPDKLIHIKKLFRESGLDYAVRIGNRINPLPVRDPYELKRIDIKGTDRFFEFKIKLKKGRMKLFS